MGTKTLVPVEELLVKAAEALRPSPPALRFPLEVARLERLGAALLNVAVEIQEAGVRTPAGLKALHALRAAGLRVHLLARAEQARCHEVAACVQLRSLQQHVTELQPAALDGCGHAFRLLRIWGEEVRVEVRDA